MDAAADDYHQKTQQLECANAKTAVLIYSMYDHWCTQSDMAQPLLARAIILQLVTAQVPSVHVHMGPAWPASMKLHGCSMRSIAGIACYMTHSPLQHSTVLALTDSHSQLRLIAIGRLCPDLILHCCLCLQVCGTAQAEAHLSQPVRELRPVWLSISYTCGNQ